MDKEKIKSFYQLFKPGLSLNIVITEVPIFIYYKVIDNFTLIFITTFGTFLCAMASSAFNQIIEQERDKLMYRTRNRFLVKYEINLQIIYFIASLMISSGSFLLGFYVGILPMFFSLFAFFNYVFIYTIWLKPRHTFNTLVGGLSGSIGPFIAESAIKGSINEFGIFLFLILFLWQPPHFWALAIFRKDDYEKAGLSMLPVVKGILFTVKQMILYYVFFIILSLIGFLYQLAGIFFLITSTGFAFFIIKKIYEFHKKNQIQLMRDIFFYTIFHNILWHISLTLDIVFKNYL